MSALTSNKNILKDSYLSVHRLREKEFGDEVQIIDLGSVRNHKLECKQLSDSNPKDLNDLRQEIVDGLTCQIAHIPGRSESDLEFCYRKSIPTVLLYDDLGLEIYDRITGVEDYYPFAAELEILQANGPEIARRLAGLPTFSSAHPSSLLNNNGTLGGCYGDSFPLSVIELGAGSLKKTYHLLKNLAVLLKPSARRSSVPDLSRAEYYALDLEYSQLVSTLKAAQKKSNSGLGPMVGSQVQVRGICGTYDQGLDWLAHAQFGYRNHRKAILWLGSSIGNLSPLEAIGFLKDKLRPLLDSESRLLVGMDNCKIPSKVGRAYNDQQGVTREFILNSVRVVARRLGLKEGALRPDQFDYVSRFNRGMSRHEAYLRARQSLVISIPSPQRSQAEVNKTIVRIEKGELIAVERSYKFSDDEAHRLFEEAGLRVIQTWSDLSSRTPNGKNYPRSPTHTLYLVEKAPFTFRQEIVLSENKHQLTVEMCEAFNNHLRTETLAGGGASNVGADMVFDVPDFHKLAVSRTQYRKHNVPSRDDWISLWAAWDTVTLGMIPKDKLLHKPIHLRHICLFYLGHIPVFADIHLNKHFGKLSSEPKSFTEIFERGIDPIVGDPSKCHPHSQVPKEEHDWPSLNQILTFRDNLRAKIFEVYDEIEENKGAIPRSLGRVLSMIYEHEAMHLETLLYMLAQANWARPPPGFTAPDWNSLSRQWDLETERQVNKGGEDEVIEFTVKRTIKIGHNDRESEDKKFDKDVILENSSVHEFGWDNESPEREVEVEPFKIELLTISNQKYFQYLVKNHPIAEPLPEELVPRSWSYEYIKPSNTGPSISEEGSISKIHQIKIKTVYGLVDFKVGKHWPVQASGTQIEGYAKWKGGRLPTAAELKLFRAETMDPNGFAWKNGGFKVWHPTPPSKPVQEDNEWTSLGNNGGVWEWTRTEFKIYKGFEPSSRYPGYSQDFFDGLHFEVVGGSWATLNRLASRKSLVNWYQLEYPYVFCGGRVAYDY